MIRDIDINEISDGSRYSKDSMVKISCNDCNGCEKCCHNMGESIILDPYDIYNMTAVTGKSFEQLLNKEISLSVVDGIILPHINMITDGTPLQIKAEDSEDLHCSFLNDGRCSIHAKRPGFCRLFPLARIYNDDGSFDYINQIYECDYANKSKIKIKKWLGIDNIGEYEKFIIDWHGGITQIKSKINADPEKQKKYNMLILQLFYVMPYEYENGDFYSQYAKRALECKKALTSK